jgi:hypothetical protein
MRVLYMAHTEEMVKVCDHNMPHAIERLEAIADVIGARKVNELITEMKQQYQDDWEGADNLSDLTIGQFVGGTE